MSRAWTGAELPSHLSGGTSLGGQGQNGGISPAGRSHHQASCFPACSQCLSMSRGSSPTAGGAAGCAAAPSPWRTGTKSSPATHGQDPVAHRAPDSKQLRLLYFPIAPLTTGKSRFPLRAGWVPSLRLGTQNRRLGCASPGWGPSSLRGRFGRSVRPTMTIAANASGSWR